MVCVTSDDVSAPVAGLAYCAVIGTCLRLGDVPRARRWISALTSWCAAQPGLVPFGGICLVHRAQVLAMEGAWADAIQEALVASGRVRSPGIAGEAWYQIGEVHRLRGEAADAEHAYRQANALGRQPEPGLARLRLAQGRVDAAATALRRLHAEPGRPDRPEILAAVVETMVCCGDLDFADAAAAELAERAAGNPVPLFAAQADTARAAVLLARGDANAAIPLLRRSAHLWQELGMPYEAARCRGRLGIALRLLGDEEAARLELEAALTAFERLGAAPDAASVRQQLTPAAPVGGLTPRELEVIRLVAAGCSNRAIAARLVLSEKTVARHLANIYAKLGISSRAAATAFAYDHQLL
jgi:ATP/maltotriose-dependent transcriptional regulator MalT